MLESLRITPAISKLEVAYEKRSSYLAVPLNPAALPLTGETRAMRSDPVAMVRTAKGVSRTDCENAIAYSRLRMLSWLLSNRAQSTLQQTLLD